MTSVSGSEDLFDCILMADDRFHGEGFQEGFKEGTRQGMVEGKNHGATHGAKLSAEVSFYYGFAFTWKCLLQNNTDAKARKRLKTLESLTGFIQRFPHYDPQYENLQEDMEKVRAKFRQVCSLLNVPTDFREYVTASEGMSF
ncbi:protein LTO1 homolog [Megalops cyprinoides]|uniref:protein LTO1 homolog n=1 Tax=Megalops cyprinoides TaxID=118141 RepID=UPI0018653551|nr:protein LTO1 homolog [Megalops cyprinoides]